MRVCVIGVCRIALQEKYDKSQKQVLEESQKGEKENAFMLNSILIGVLN